MADRYYSDTPHEELYVYIDEVMQHLDEKKGEFGVHEIMTLLFEWNGEVMPPMEVRTNDDRYKTFYDRVYSYIQRRFQNESIERHGRGTYSLADDFEPLDELQDKARQPKEPKEYDGPNEKSRKMSKAIRNGKRGRSTQILEYFHDNPGKAMTSNEVAKALFPNEYAKDERGTQDRTNAAVVRLYNKETGIDRVQHGIYVYRGEAKPEPEPEPEPEIKEQDVQEEPNQQQEEPDPTPPQVQESVVPVELTLDVVVSNGTVSVAKGSDGHLYRVEYELL